MSYLRITLWCLGLIILVEFLKKVFAAIFFEETAFHHNFLMTVQVIILLWTIITLLSKKITSRSSNRRNFLILFLLLAIPELLFTYWLHHPTRIPSFLVPTFHNYYFGMQRNHVQWNRNSGVYNSQLFYTLKPNSRFVFEDYEFSDSFYTNNKGLRDDERSLIRPEIICMGDSYGMGWGVGQNETFAELLGRHSGKIVLNTSIPSYGTARELINLYRLDTSNLKYIIIQYCRNDANENAEFVSGNYSLHISPEAKFNSAANTYRWMKAWFPVKHFISISKMYASKKLSGLLSTNIKDPYEISDSQLHKSAVDFADILLHSAINFKKIKVYVIDVSEKEEMNDDFINQVKALTDLPFYKEHFNNNVIMVPVADLLKREDYFILDIHIRSSGHQKIAARLSNYMFSEKEEEGL